MMMLPKYESMEIYEASQQKRYLALLPQLGSHVRFEDDTWICDKRIRSATEPPHYSHIYYSAVPAGCKELVKYYVILRLLQGDTVRTVKSRISRLVPLLRFLENGSKEALLSECDCENRIQVQGASGGFKPCLQHNPGRLERSRFLAPYHEWL